MNDDTFSYFMISFLAFFVGIGSIVTGKSGVSKLAYSISLEGGAAYGFGLGWVLYSVVGVYFFWKNIFLPLRNSSFDRKRLYLFICLWAVCYLLVVIFWMFLVPILSYPIVAILLLYLIFVSWQTFHFYNEFKHWKEENISL
jgi:fatty acid desaturase